MSLDLRTCRSVWSIGRQKRAGHRKLEKNIRTEVVVVGGGVSGALIAHELVGRGLHVVMVDARDIAMGSTMASTAILSYEPDVHLIDLIPLIGEKSAVRVYRAGIEAIDSLAQTIAELDDPCDLGCLNPSLSVPWAKPPIDREPACILVRRWRIFSDEVGLLGVFR